MFVSWQAGAYRVLLCLGSCSSHCEGSQCRLQITSLSAATSSSVGWCREQAMPFSLRREDHREGQKAFPPSWEFAWIFGNRLCSVRADTSGKHLDEREHSLP